MKKQNFAICDLEAKYACNLMEFMTGRQKIPFEVLVFAELDSLRLFVKEHTIDLLLISAQMMCEEVRRMDIGKILILTDGEFVEAYRDYPTIYKYQASDSIVCEVMNYCARETEAPPLPLHGTARILGVYSPVRRCGKTCFALALGQILAQRQSVLYLNMEDYAGFGRLTGNEFTSDLSDVMYFMRQRQGNLLYKLHAVTHRIGKLDYIPPAFSSEDLREIRLEEWRTLLQDISRVGGYDVVILDLGEAVEERFALLTECDVVYTPIMDDPIARSKVAQYEKLIDEMDYDEILERTQYLYLPFAEPAAEGEYFLEQLVQGDMGDYVRRLLSGTERSGR